MSMLASPFGTVVDRGELSSVMRLDLFYSQPGVELRDARRLKLPNHWPALRALE